MEKGKKPTHESEQGEAAMEEMAVMTSNFYKTLIAEGMQPSDAYGLTREWMVTMLRLSLNRYNSGPENI